MRCIFICLIIFGFISPAHSADILYTQEDPFSRGAKSPPHPHIEEYNKLLKEATRTPISENSPQEVKRTKKAEAPPLPFDTDSQLPQSELRQACKLILYIADHLGFLRIISTKDAPYQLSVQTPEQQYRELYLTNINYKWEQHKEASSHPYRNFYDYSADCMTIWLANLLLALEQSRSKETEQKAQETLQRFVEAVNPENKGKKPEERITKLRDYCQELPKLTEERHALLDSIYHDVLTHKFICKETGNTVFVNQTLGCVTTLPRKQRYTCNKQADPDEHPAHSHDFIAKYLGLYRDSQNDSIFQ